MACISTVPVIQVSALYEVLIAIRNAGGATGSPFDDAIHAFLDGDIKRGKKLSKTALGSFAGAHPAYDDFHRDFARELVKAVKVIGWMQRSEHAIDSLAGWNESSTIGQMCSDLVREFDKKVRYTSIRYDMVPN